MVGMPQHEEPGLLHRVPGLSITGGLGVLVFWLLHIALRGYPPGDPARVFAVAMIVLGVALFVVGQVQIVRRLDEFQRQVQLRALSIAFPVSLVAAFAIGFLSGEGLLHSLDPRDLPAVMIVSYLLGLVLAWRRYR